MKYYVEEQAWKAILSFLRKKKLYTTRMRRKSDSLLKQYGLLLEQVVNGVFCLIIMVVGTVFIVDLKDGLTKAYGKL